MEPYSANLFVHGTSGVLNDRSQSYPIPDKIGLLEGLTARNF